MRNHDYYFLIPSHFFHKELQFVFWLEFIITVYDILGEWTPNNYWRWWCIVFVINLLVVVVADVL